MLAIFSLSVLALGLAMDAVAVAVAQGAAGRAHRASALVIGLAFGAAQGLMPLIGWTIGSAFLPLVRSVDHRIAFVLLSFLGGRMIREAREPRAGGPGEPLAGLALLSAAVATSIDALAAGVTLPALAVPVLPACVTIGGVTGLLSLLGVHVGAAAGSRVGKWAEMAGGLVLIGLGFKILIQHQFYGG
jgi:putative Mn2+ efflux pump MntP